jgi:hypothetical protein
MGNTIRVNTVKILDWMVNYSILSIAGSMQPMMDSVEYHVGLFVTIVMSRDTNGVRIFFLITVKTVVQRLNMVTTALRKNITSEENASPLMGYYLVNYVV